MLSNELFEYLVVAIISGIVPLGTLIATLISTARRERRQEEREGRRIRDERTYRDRTVLQEQARANAIAALDAISDIENDWESQGYRSNPTDIYEMNAAMTRRLLRAANLITEKDVRDTVTHVVHGINSVYHVYAAGLVSDPDENWAGGAQQEILSLAKDAVNGFLRGEPVDPVTLASALGASEAGRQARIERFGY